MLRFNIFIMLASSVLCLTLISAEESLPCGENEEYSKCSNGGCFKTNCTQVGRPGFCIDLPESACVPGCICKHDHLRNARGTCVPIKDCPMDEVCSKPNEYYDFCTPSCPQRDCRYDDEATCPPQKEVGDPSCYPSCRCKEGFYRKYSGFYEDCVPYEDCSKFCYGKNEYFAAYPKTCEPQTCDSVNDTNVLQTASTTCSSECRCHPGYLRNTHGECIAKETCGKCEGPHEYFGCKSSCDDVCATLYETNEDCTTTNDSGACIEQCYCDAGYARDANSICIPIPECPMKNNTS